MLRILFSSVGRRVELLREFRRAAGEMGEELEIHAVDCQRTAPGLQEADRTALAPRVGKELTDWQVEYCKQNKIDALVPLIDPELLPLSQARERFTEIGTRAVVSSPEVMKIATDKELTAQFLLENGFHSPRVLNAEQLVAARLPLFIKPRSGSASQGAYKIATKEAFEYYRTIYPDSIIEEFVEGHEHTVDVFCDFDGQPLCAVPRKRLEVRGGEVSKGLTVRHEEMIVQSLRLAAALKTCLGMITIQCFLTGSGQITFTEINGRFGGGAPLSIRAGADSPRWLMELLLGRRPKADPQAWQDKLVMLRYDAAFFLKFDELPK